MEPIFDFSAAPHLPKSLRAPSAPTPRPEFVLTLLLNAVTPTTNISVQERNGEIYIDFATAA